MTVQYSDSTVTDSTVTVTVTDGDSTVTLTVTVTVTQHLIEKVTVVTTVLLAVANKRLNANRLNHNSILCHLSKATYTNGVSKTA